MPSQHSCSLGQWFKLASVHDYDSFVGICRKTFTTLVVVTSLEAWLNSWITIERTRWLNVLALWYI